MASWMDDRKEQTGDPPTPLEQEEGVILSPDTFRDNRIPPNQSRTRKWPVLDAYGPPRIDLSTWQFEIKGLVEQPLHLTWAEFQQLPRVRVFADMHCVTRWSRLGNLWEGVSPRELIERAKPSPEARYVLAHAYDYGWSANMAIEELTAEDCVFADRHDGELIDADHGGPLRLVVPRLYAWKSAKWVSGLEFIAEDRPGFWERGGYHMHGDPWKEERYNW